MIPIACKITNFFLYLFVYFFENNNFSCLICIYRFEGKNSWRTPQQLIIGTLISQFALYSALLRLLQKYEKYLYNPSSHNWKYGEHAREKCAKKTNYWKAHKPVCFIFSYILSVTQQYKQRAAWKASLQSIQPLRRIRRIYSWNACPISRYVKAIAIIFSNVELIS